MLLYIILLHNICCLDIVHSYMDQLIKLLHGLKSMNPEPEDMEFDHLGLPRDLKGTASD